MVEAEGQKKEEGQEEEGAGAKQKLYSPAKGWGNLSTDKGHEEKISQD